ncbi:MAG: RICIN domain-containing protein [Pseudolysinimonas sp.]
MTARSTKRGFGRQAKLGIAAALIGFLVLAGTTAGFAYWTASNTVTSTVGAATLTLTTANFTSVGYTFGNDSLVTTGSVTVTNTTTTTSTQNGAVSVTFAPAASAPLASKVTANIWTTPSAANCTAAATVPSGATTALWSASTVLTSSLAKNASVIYCVRSSIASRDSVASTSGTQTFQPKISGTITVGNFTGSASATTTQSTQFIYPGSTTADLTHWNWIRPNWTTSTYNYCLDVSGGGGGDGSLVISYGCKNSGASNQNWKFTASGATGYYTIQPRSATGFRVDDTSSTTSGTGITINTAAAAPATATNQQWQLQLVSTGIYEFVNAFSGMCLSSPNGTDQNLGQLTQAPCSGTVYQQFKVSQAFENFTCARSGNNWVWSWTSVTTGPYHVLVTRGATTTELVTTAATAAGATLAFSSANYGTGTYNVAFVDGNGTAVGSGTIVIANQSNNNTCSAYDFQ